MKYVLVAIALLTFSAFSAEARHRHHRAMPTAVKCVETNVIFPSCGMVQPFSGAATIKVVMHKEPRSERVVHYTREAQIVSHPTGCPSRAFCGCGAAVRVFGHAVRELWLAANWFKFPRTAPAPGMVAVRRHHVFVLEAQASSGNWVVYDANSGGHATRIHERSLAGYTIVNPHA